MLTNIYGLICSYVSLARMQDPLRRTLSPHFVEGTCFTNTMDENAHRIPQTPRERSRGCCGYVSFRSSAVIRFQIKGCNDECMCSENYLQHLNAIYMFKYISLTFCNIKGTQLTIIQTPPHLPLYTRL